MMREARGARTQLMRNRAERRKRGSDNATRDHAAWTDDAGAAGRGANGHPGPAPPLPAPEPRRTAGHRAWRRRGSTLRSGVRGVRTPIRAQ